SHGSADPQFFQLRHPGAGLADPARRLLDDADAHAGRGAARIRGRPRRGARFHDKKFLRAGRGGRLRRFVPRLSAAGAADARRLRPAVPRYPPGRVRLGGARLLPQHLELLRRDPARRDRIGAARAAGSGALDRALGAAGHGPGGAAAGGPAIDCVTLKEGPPGIETQEHVDSVVQPLLHLVRESESRYAAFVIACYSDPGLHSLREATRKPVLGISESGILTALTLGQK